MENTEKNNESGNIHASGSVANLLERREIDHLVIGSGIGGLMLALKLAKSGRVLVIAKGSLVETNTWYAQGGIASVFSAEDSFANHVDDTVKAGAGLCHEKIVQLVVENGPRLVRELIAMGVKFTEDVEGATPPADGSFGYHLTREGGHSHRRVVHANDLTGKEILTALAVQVRQHPEIEVLENQIAVDLLTTDKYAPQFDVNRCIGAYVLDRSTMQVYQVRSRNTYLCTGGHGKVYLYTSNPDSATGDGVAMAWRAGCRVANLEFMQFHPTCLYHHRAKTFLISEAVRGEGGILRDSRGRAFMDDYDARGSLASRDIVARAIDNELKKSGETNAFLDVRHLGEEKIKSHFPNIYETCKSYGIDMAREMIPVVPAAHYSCGGVVVDEVGRTNVQGLYAIGEVACTGLHGANRLASNSLLEAVVFADKVAEHVSTLSADWNYSSVETPDWQAGDAASEDELVVLSHTWDEIRRLMWHYVGIVRSERRLKRALDRITVIRAELDTYYWDHRLTDSLIEVRNLALVAWLTIRCAMARKESRGIHYMLDYPEIDSKGQMRDTVLSQ